MFLAKEVKVFRSIDEIGNIVDSISNDPFFTYGYFKTLETQRTQKILPIYIAVFEEKKIVAFAPFFFDLIEKPQKNIFTLLLNLTNVFGFSLNKQLMGYSPRCYRSKILLSDEKNRKSILNLLLKEVDLICSEQKILKSQFAFVSEFDDYLSDSFENHGYQKSVAMTTCYLDVKWKNFEEYVNSLKSKTRKNVKREIKKCLENGVTIQEAELANFPEKLDELYNNLALKYNKNAEKIYDSYFFSRLNMYAKDKTKLFIAKKNDDLIGFSLTLWHKDVMDVVIVGFNYDVQSKTDFSYFNLTYYAPIKWGIENGIKKIYYRLTMEKIKLDRGCSLEKTFFFVKYHNVFLNIIYVKMVKNSFFNRLISRYW